MITTLKNFLNNNLILVIPIISIILVLTIIYNWKRRWLYYYSYKLPGPMALPLLGSIHLLRKPQDIHIFLRKLFTSYPSVMSVWLGNELFIGTTEPHHLKKLLTTFLDKGDFYDKMSEYFHRALAAAPVELWKKNRKNINPTFNVSLINSFADAFVKYGEKLADDLEVYCGSLSDDLFSRVWKCTLDAGCETLSNVDPALVKTEEYIPSVYRLEEILQQRFFNPFLHINFIWKLSSLREELLKLWRVNCSLIEKLIRLRQDSLETETTSSKKRFLDHLVDASKSNEIPKDYVLEEAQIIYFVGTETSGVALSSTLVVLGIYPEVQQKIYDELFSIFGNSTRAPTLEDVNQMEYLERVIKETLRLLPPIPFVMRQLDENIQLDDYIFPKGAKLVVPIAEVHRRSDFWPNPDKFDPDRFLPDQVESRPPCSFIPFSYGVRNCIGYKYGLLSMKVILSSVLRRYRILSSNYKSIQDIKLYIHVVAKAKEGYKVVLEKR